VLKNDGFIGIHQPSVILFRYYFFAGSAFGSTFLGVGFSDLGAGGHLPCLSLVTQFVSSFFASGFFAGSAAKETDANANITNAIIDFIIVSYKN
jgi:hypothetical protein